MIPARYLRPAITILAISALFIFQINASALAAMAECKTTTLQDFAIPNVTYSTVSDVPAAPPVPEYCHVVGFVASSSGNPHGDGFEFDLPANWNGRFLMRGGRGFVGSVNPPDPADLAKGFGVGSTDAGHSASNLNWTNTPSEITDYFYLAMHNVTVAGKELIRDFYDVGSINYSYFQGCSTGGRQALVEAERYPDDFDGIVAGDAFMDHRYVLGQLKGEFALLKASSAYIPAPLLPTIDAAVYRNCDATDGVKDGLIQDPLRCSFNPQSLLCGTNGNETPDCLTQDQVNALETYLGPLTNAEGNLVAFGYPVSDLSGRDGMPLWFLGSNPPSNFTGPEPWVAPESPPFAWSFADNTLKYLVYHDPSFDTFDYSMSNDGVIDDAALALFDKRIDAGNADEPAALSKYLAEGKKLLMYHGFSDGGLSPFRTIQFYEDLTELTHGHYHDLQQQVRLFMVPGMHQCSGGPGPNVFDMLTPLIKWVERGIAPNGIIATHYVANDEANPPDRTMPLCMFPEQARYSGTGDVDVAANWSCPPNRTLLRLGPDGLTFSGLKEEGNSIGSPGSKRGKRNK